MGKRPVQIFIFLISMLAAANGNASEAGKFNVIVKTGLQTSTFSDGSSATGTDNSSQIFKDNKFFVDIASTTKIKEKYDLIAGVRLGRKSVNGKDPSNPGFDNIVKDAEVAEGVLGLILMPEWSSNHLDNNIYYKVQCGFIKTSDSRIKDEFLFDSFAGAGYKVTEKKYHGSIIELGYGYSERFRKWHRFKAALEFVWNSESEIKPFINGRVDVGDGPDDFIIYYGIRTDAKNIFDSITKMFNPKEDASPPAEAPKKPESTADPLGFMF